jgi:hypothetical protein
MVDKIDNILYNVMTICINSTVTANTPNRVFADVTLN